MTKIFKIKKVDHWAYADKTFKITQRGSAKYVHYIEHITQRRQRKMLCRRETGPRKLIRIVHQIPKKSWR